VHPCSRSWQRILPPPPPQTAHTDRATQLPGFPFVHKFTHLAFATNQHRLLWKEKKKDEAFVSLTLQKRQRYGIGAEPVSFLLLTRILRARRDERLTFPFWQRKKQRIWAPLKTHPQATRYRSRQKLHLDAELRTDRGLSFAIPRKRPLHIDSHETRLYTGGGCVPTVQMSRCPNRHFCWWGSRSFPNARLSLFGRSRSQNVLTGQLPYVPLNHKRELTGD
jgi:hypothetical protein